MNKSHFEKQIKLLKNQLFNVLILNRKTKEAKKYNLSGREELTEKEVIELYNKLKFYNNKNSFCDIYLIPVDTPENQNYNIIIDDLTLENVQKLVKFIKVEYILFSSKNNYQAVINLSKSLFNKGEADFLVKYINKKIGDPKALGAIRFFRAAGFYNRKLKNNGEMAYLVDLTNNFEICSEELSLKNIHKILEQNKNSIKNHSENEEKEEITAQNLTENEAKLARREIIAEIEFCKKTFKNQLDMSIVDFRIVKRLYKKGFNKNKIALAFYNFTDFKNRHASPEDYLNRTINKAISELNKK